MFGIFLSNSKITLYGSRAQKSSRGGSDIYLGFDADALTLKDINELEAIIDDLLLPWKIDITVWQQIDNLNLIEHIERVGVQLYPA